MSALGVVNGSSALEAGSLSARADDRDQHGVIRRGGNPEGAACDIRQGTAVIAGRKALSSLVIAPTAKAVR
jgi:hypothetical protein